MVTLTSQRNIEPQDILIAFAQNGFKKTSMEDIARAAGVSRQSIYNKFGAKDACYDWAVNTHLTNVYGRVFEILSEDTASPISALALVFNTTIGDAIALVTMPHGVELFDHTMKISNSSDEDWALRYQTRLGAFLFRNGFAGSNQEGIELAFVLIAASRGLSVQARTKEEFTTLMRRILEAALGRNGWST